jgi:hypothetical protein
MSDASAQVLKLECQKCHKWYPAYISGPMLEQLEDAGIDPDDIAASIDAGLTAWRLTCPRCAAVAQN